MTEFRERVLERNCWALRGFTQEELVTLAYALVDGYDRKTQDAADSLLCFADPFELAYVIKVDLGEIQDELEREHEEYRADMEALRNEYMRVAI